MHTLRTHISVCRAHISMWQTYRSVLQDSCSFAAEARRSGGLCPPKEAGGFGGLQAPQWLTPYLGSHPLEPREPVPLNYPSVTPTKKEFTDTKTASKWHHSDIKATSKRHQSDITATSKPPRSNNLIVTSKRHQSGIKAISK